MHPASRNKHAVRVHARSALQDARIIAVGWWWLTHSVVVVVLGTMRTWCHPRHNFCLGTLLSPQRAAMAGEWADVRN